MGGGKPWNKHTSGILQSSDMRTETPGQVPCWAGPECMGGWARLARPELSFLHTHYRASSSRVLVCLPAKLHVRVLADPTSARGPEEGPAHRIKLRPGLPGPALRGDLETLPRRSAGSFSCVWFIPEGGLNNIFYSRAVIQEENKEADKQTSKKDFSWTSRLIM